ncbi:hypothetical protein SPB21_02500 [Leptothoe sp. ISB3NOV94-8A]
MKSVAAHHPIIEQLNQLNAADWLEAEPLIFQCFEEGIFEWSNPKFLAFLEATITGLLTIPRHERKQLRGMMYARYVAEHMPVGIDDDIRNQIAAIAAGQPVPKLVRGIWRGPSCVWPSHRSSLWSGRAFWVIQQQFVDGKLAVDLLRRRAKLRRQQKAS